MIAIITNGYYSTESSKHQENRLKEELNNLGQDAEIIKNLHPHTLNINPNFKKAIFLDKDIAYASILEANGVRLYNPAKALELSDNKQKTLVSVKNLTGFKIPKTMFLPLNYKGAIDGEIFNEIEDTLKYPLIIKECIGSLGEQVYKVNDRESLEKVASCISKTQHMYQEYICKSEGKSIRTYVVGNQIAGSVRYSNEKDFRSNAFWGGRAELIEIKESFKTAAIKISQCLGLDFCAIDFFDLDEPMLIEVNSNAYFIAVENFGINIAKKIAEHIIGSK